jgi:branched-chain amino acid transport system permease protein
MRALDAVRLVSILCACIAAFMPFWGNNYHLTVAVNLCVTLIMTLSLNLVVGYSGQLHLSHAAFFGSGAYLAAILAKQLGLSPWLALFASVCGVSLLAAAVGAPATRLKGLYLAVATLAFSLFIEVLVVQGGAITGGGYGIMDIPAAYLGSVRLTGKYFYAVALVALGFTLFAVYGIRHSKLGREIIAARDHPDAAEASGINPPRIRMVVLMLGAAIAALGGWVHTFYHLTLSPSLLNPEWTFVWFFMVLVGGIGSMLGVVLGTLVLSLVPEFFGFASGQTVFGIGLLMIFMTLFLPRGLSGLISDCARRIEAHRGPA